MNMGLFIVLLVLGCCFLLSIYLDYRRKSRENYMVDQSLMRARMLENKSKFEKQDEKTEESDNSLSNIIIVHIHAQDDQKIPGDKLLKTLLVNKLRFGSMKIFHYYDENKEELFSVSSIVNPGYFNISDISTSKFPGVSLFFIRDNVTSPAKSYSKMLEVARKVAEDLDCEILDENHELLSAEKISFTLEKFRNHAEDLLFQ